MSRGQYVPKQTNKFDVIERALELADYVFQITENIKTFPMQIASVEKVSEEGKVVAIYVATQNALAKEIQKQANDIYLLLFTANMIDLRYEPERKEERLAKQRRAVELCNLHFAEMELCRKHLHLSTKRIGHWGKMTKELKELIRNWIISDKDRYKNI